MSRNSNLGNLVGLAAVAFFVVLGCWAQTQTTSPSTSPPNCVCLTQQALNSGSASGSQTNFGRRNRNKLICGTDNVNYTDGCTFVNAQGRNPNLGRKLQCQNRGRFPNSNNNGQVNNAAIGGSQNSNIFGNTNGEFQNFNNNGNSNGGFQNQRQQKSATSCLTNGQTLNATMQSMQQLFTTNPPLGIRCHGPCPCILRCPRVRGYAQG